MEQHTSTREVLTQIDALLGRVSAAERVGLSASERLDLVSLARRVSGRVSTLTSVIVAEADKAKAAETAAGSSSGTWLAHQEHLSGGNANGLVLQATRLADHAGVLAAALAGDLRPEQGRAAVTLLDSLSEDLTAEEEAAAEQVVLTRGSTRTAAQISGMAREVLHALRPDTAEEDAADRLERQRRRAWRDRYLTLTPTGEGSVSLRGSLPILEAGPSTILDVGQTQRLVTPTIRRAIEIRDTGCAFPGCDTPTVKCEAHHIIRWWAGGDTALHNLVLLCPHHHSLCEPTKPPPWHQPAIHSGVRRAAHHRPEQGQPPGIPTPEQQRSMPDDPSRWTIHIANDGTPESPPTHPHRPTPQTPTTPPIPHQRHRRAPDPGSVNRKQQVSGCRSATAD